MASELGRLVETITKKIKDVPEIPSFLSFHLIEFGAVLISLIPFVFPGEVLRLNLDILEKRLLVLPSIVLVLSLTALASSFILFFNGSKFSEDFDFTISLELMYFMS